MRVISPAAVPDERLVVDAGYMGAPTVGNEKLDADQAEAAVQAVLEAYRSSAAPAAERRAEPPHMGGEGSSEGASTQPALDTAAPAAAAQPAQRQLAALMAGEVGGGNGIEPLVVGSRLGLPVVDGDLMGRAFPELQVGWRLGWQVYVCGVMLASRRAHALGCGHQHQRTHAASRRRQRQLSADRWPTLTCRLSCAAVQMMTSAIYGLPVLPAAVADEKGNCLAVQRAASPAWLERLLRPVCTEMGCSAGFSSCPLTGAPCRLHAPGAGAGLGCRQAVRHVHACAAGWVAWCDLETLAATDCLHCHNWSSHAGQQLKQVVVPHSLSLALRLGSAVAAAQHAKQDAPAAIAAAGGGRVLFTGGAAAVAGGWLQRFGCQPSLHPDAACPQPFCLAGKVVDVQRQTTQGFARGRLLLEGSGAFAGRTLTVDFQNENLLAVEGPGERLLASVPDLICCVEAESEPRCWRPLCPCLCRQSTRGWQPANGMPWPAALLCRWAAHRHRGAAVWAACGGGGPAGAPAADLARGASRGGPRGIRAQQCGARAPGAVCGCGRDTGWRHRLTAIPLCLPASRPLGCAMPRPLLPRA